VKQRCCFLTGPITTRPALNKFYCSDETQFHGLPPGHKPVPSTVDTRRCLEEGKCCDGQPVDWKAMPV